jgi:ABC-type multidrug transport system fused ATPase/permease subunit
MREYGATDIPGDGLLSQHTRHFPVPSGSIDDLSRAKGLYALIFKISGQHQIVLAIVTTVLFLISAVPLELQRRLVNDTLKRGELRMVVTLALAYFGVALAQGAIKLGMNVYRGWVSENSTRYLRSVILCAEGKTNGEFQSEHKGVDISIVLAEAEPIGNFVGVSFSEPLLQCGILISLLSYMTYLQPWMAVIALGALAPQLLYVPAMQNAINRRATGRIMTLRSISTALNRGQILPEVASRQLEKAGHVFDLNMSIFRIKYVMNFLMNSSFHLSMAGILALGGYYVAIGRIDIGSVIACAGGLQRINDPWGDLVDWFRELRVTQAKFALLRSAELQVLEAAVAPPRPSRLLPAEGREPGR